MSYFQWLRESCACSPRITSRSPWNTLAETTTSSAEMVSSHFPFFCSSVIPVINYCKQMGLEKIFWSRIHERTISLRYLGRILRVLTEVSLYNVYITNHVFPKGGGGGVKSVSRGDCEYQGGKLFRLLSQWCPWIRPLDIERRITRPLRHSLIIRVNILLRFDKSEAPIWLSDHFDVQKRDCNIHNK